MAARPDVEELEAGLFCAFAYQSTLLCAIRPDRPMVGFGQRNCWMRVTRRPPRPCFSIAASQPRNSSAERL
jgi:hypothetical protein